MPPKKQVEEQDNGRITKPNLKAACWYTVSKLAEEEQLALGCTFSEELVGALSEVVFKQALALGGDLEAFARHASRSVIGVDDVRLAIRRNESLQAVLLDYATSRGLELAPRPKAKRLTSANPKSEASASTSNAEAGPSKGKKAKRDI